MKRNIRFATLLLLITVTISCGKDSESEQVKTKTELLTAGTWKLIAATINPAYDYYGDGSPTTNIFSILKDCERDDFEVYKTDGTFEYNEGPTKCDPSSPQVFSLPWHFADNETTLFVDTVECIILELTANTLKLRYSFEDSGVTYTEEDTYQH